ncbi:globin [Alicyclobacillus tolerans]|uniref:Hemoglobin n=2 Tax=Alicyclobacillus tolerans TaxID=90970 RepID=A0A1M6JU21_9BACL|nr:MULTISPECIES: globin [Alicyclobacillus]MDP9727404.1 hemoglobin [Alicyclobacillus tengchongensis]QRF24642.1 globin [Alicyclobacillus sp. TC]SHJ50110.1 hemoglobin [Alicyclobacillus montanus]
MEVKSIYEAIGGQNTIANLVDIFYTKVQKNELLRPLFPEDIKPVRDKQLMFLTQFFGGPSLYTNMYGHPMLRAKHLAHPITQAHASEWIRCMEESLNQIGIDHSVQEFMLERLRLTAQHMINR